MQMIPIVKMPDKYEDRLGMLDKILRSSMELLLKEARKREVLNPPYGRPPTPSPFVDDEDIDAITGDDLEEEVIEFSYDYGFNPITLLSELIMKQHPNTIAERREKIYVASDRLKFRVAHAVRQLNTAAELNNIYLQYKCGILHGPITSPITSTSVLCICRAIAKGEVVIQVSRIATFNTIVGVYKEVARNPEIPVRIVIDKLEPGTHYYFRCCLQDEGYDAPPEEKTRQVNITPSNGHRGSLKSMQSTRILPPANTPLYRAHSKVPLLNDMPVSADISNIPKLFDGKFRGIDEDSFRGGEFWTTPADSESSPPISLIAFSRSTPTSQFNIEELRKECTIMLPDDLEEDTDMVITCLLGDIIGQVNQPPLRSPKPSHQLTHHQTLRNSLWSLYHHSGVFREESSILRKTPLLLGWDDRSNGADTGLKAEEVLHKQYLSEIRKFDRRAKRTSRKNNSLNGPRLQPMSPVKPPPVLQRPPLSTSVEILSQEMPLILKEDVARQAYRLINVGTSLQILSLDSRKGYLGRQQVKWLKECILTSRTTWTIVLSGFPFGYDIQVIDGSSRSKDEFDTSGRSNNNSPPTNTGNTGMTVEKEAVIEDEKLPEEEKEEEKDDDKDDGEAGEDGHDEDGDGDELLKDKGRLQYSFASLQRIFINPANVPEPEEEEEEEDMPRTPQKIQRRSSSGNDSLANKSIRSIPAKGASIAASATSDDHSIASSESMDRNNNDIIVDSAVVLLSGGFANPFVATYDMCKWGSHFMVEVGVGSIVTAGGNGGTTTSGHAYEEVRPISNIGRTMLFEGIGVGVETTSAAGYTPSSAAVVPSTHHPMTATTSSGTSASIPHICIVKLISETRLSIKIVDAENPSIIHYEGTFRPPADALLVQPTTSVPHTPNASN